MIILLDTYVYITLLKFKNSFMYRNNIRIVWSDDMSKYVQYEQVEK